MLLPHDLTRGGSNYSWHGRTDVKQLALYAQDQITKGPWLLNIGIRGDVRIDLISEYPGRGFE